MERIPLETFQRHFLLTHLKNKPECVLAHLQRQWPPVARSFGDLVAELIRACWADQTAYVCDNWYSSEIPLNKCYFAQGDFRGFRVPKDGLIVGFLDKHVGEIESHRFPMAREIRADWKPMPPPMIEERDPDDWTVRVTGEGQIQKNVGRERYYVLDGQLRVIRHWYHKRLSVPVYIYRGHNGKV